ncbi:hypothetical protein, partial [Streptomyces sp. NPDC046685]|uniref:hypothetical protein n=1 Tax=Streptomyces sp. NPDC046685 TaxID=3157202 RepID=UPI0033FA885B
RRVVGPRRYVQYEPRSSALRCTAPDAATRQTSPATALAGDQALKTADAHLDRYWASIAPLYPRSTPGRAQG